MLKQRKLTANIEVCEENDNSDFSREILSLCSHNISAKFEIPSTVSHNFISFHDVIAQNTKTIHFNLYGICPDPNRNMIRAPKQSSNLSNHVYEVPVIKFYQGDTVFACFSPGVIPLPVSFSSKSCKLYHTLITL